MLHIVTGTYEILNPQFGQTPLRLEADLGCGKGGFAIALAKRYPQRRILAADVMLGRLRRLQRKVVRQGLGNLELLRANILELVAYQLPDSCLHRIHWLCPDPWPKARHRGKRLATTDFFAKLARVLEPDGILHVATDHPPYHDAITAALESVTFFHPDPDAIADIADVQTDFEALWQAQGKTVAHLACRCVKQRL